MRVLLFIITLAALAASYALQYWWQLHPCPLCMMQRFMVMFILATLIVLLIVKSARLKKWLLSLQFIWSMAGIYFSGRQIYLQHLPEADIPPSCMPDFEIMLHYFPWQQTLKAMVLGDGDCARDIWSFLGLSLPEWSLIYFVLIILGSIYLYQRVCK